MKTFLLTLVMLIGVMATFTQCQPKTDYEIYGGTITSAVKYHFFIEKKPAVGSYHLVFGMDYLAPDVTVYKVGEATIPVFTVNLDNDGSEYAVGIVAESAGGFYGGMGVGIGTVGEVPGIPQPVGLRKKQ